MGTSAAQPWRSACRSTVLVSFVWQSAQADADAFVALSRGGNPFYTDACFARLALAVSQSRSLAPMECFTRNTNNRETVWKRCKERAAAVDCAAHC